ncbi:MAG: NAD-dependent epimerase/dehydratase family protein [Acidobacteriota bacterium]
MPTCLLTGATGFLGSHVARSLLARGWSVRALVRGGPERLGTLPAAGVEVVAGDLSAATDLDAAASRVDAVVHVAGITKARTREEYREGNARGTARLVDAARRSAPGALFLLVSSQAAAGPARGGRPVAEEDPPRPVSWYGESKREGEEAVRAAWRGPWVVIRPSVVFGPGDRGLLLLFRAAAKGWLPVPAADSRIQLIRAERAADAIAAAAARPDLAGRAGFLADPAPRTIGELSTLIASLPPKRPRLVAVPRAAVRVAGAVETVVESLTRRSRPFNADKAREILAGDWICDGTPLARDLRLPEAPPLREDLAATWGWYVREGWLSL